MCTNRNNSPAQKAAWEKNKALGPNSSRHFKFFRSTTTRGADLLPVQRIGFNAGVSDACGLGAGHARRVGRMLRHGGVRLHGHSRNFQTEMDARNRVSYVGRRVHPNLINGVVFALKSQKARVRQEHEAAQRFADIGLQPVELDATPRL